MTNKSTEQPETVQQIKPEDTGDRETCDNQMTGDKPSEIDNKQSSPLLSPSRASSTSSTELPNDHEGPLNDLQIRPSSSGEEKSKLDGNDQACQSNSEDSGDGSASNNNNNIAFGDLDDGDPIPSGTGSVSKDCTATELVGWSELLPKWHLKLRQRPKGLEELIRSNGIPEPLRGEVWQLLSGAHESSDLMDKYRIYLTKSTPSEQIILRDIHRTYPAHENFKTDSQSSLTDSLFKVCKAYAVFDEEIGYCQGLSFLVAALLLHMPEEQAFCVFTRIMQQYGLRNLFRNNFDELCLKFYQLEQLLKEHMPDLSDHFTRIGIEPFFYASQWFLTVFTAKFPLNAVFHIMDQFLLDGMNTIFQIALALLSSSRLELLALDFEGVLRYFRVHMPKRYRNQENVKLLIQTSSKMSVKKLKKFAKNYELKQQKEVLPQKQNPSTYIQLRSQLEFFEDKLENLTKENQSHLHTISDMEDEKARLEVEVSQLKEVFRRELGRAETELARDSSIVSDYKKICSQLSRRLDARNDLIDKFIQSTRDLLNDNKNCNEKSCLRLFDEKVDDFYKLLSNLDNVQANNQLQQQQQQLQQVAPSDQKPVDEQPKRRISGDKIIGAYVRDSTKPEATSSETKLRHLNQHIDDLEVELAKTKLALVEAECRCQQLTHDLSVGASIEMSSNNSPSLNSGMLSGKLDFVKAAVTNRKPASVAFARINNLLSEKMTSSPTTF